MFEHINLLILFSCETSLDMSELACPGFTVQSIWSLPVCVIKAVKLWNNFALFLCNLKC